jgi:hypothetical protein
VGFECIGGLGGEMKREALAGGSKVSWFRTQFCCQAVHSAVTSMPSSKDQMRIKWLFSK